MPQIPHLVVPSWRELPSGLQIPSSVAERVASAEETDVPIELRGEPTPVAVVDALPVSADQHAGALLGAPVS